MAVSTESDLRTAAPAPSAQSALESPTESIRIVKPRAWLALVACLFLAACAIAWSMIVQIPISVATPGAVLPSGSLVPVISPVEGRIVQIQAKANEDVKKGTAVATVETGLGKRVAITAPTDGTINSFLSGIGTIVARDTVVANLVDYAGPLTLRMFPDPVTAQQLVKGSRVIVEVVGAGGVRATFNTQVSEINEPVTATQAATLVGDDALTGLLVGGNPIVSPVVANLDPQELVDELTAQGFPIDDESGASSFLVSATFIVGEKHPIEYVFGSNS